MVNNSATGAMHPAEETEMLRVCEAVLADTFRSWGYREANTPVIDSAEILETDTGRAVYRFMDPQGQVLALRPDWTTPIAHLAATRREYDMLPLRLFYRGSVFRREDMRAREVHQAGVEVLGAAGDLADGEVVSLAVRSLAAVGLQEFRIGIGHVGFSAGLMSHWGIREPDRIRLQNALIQRDFVTFRQEAKNLDIPSSRQTFLQRLPELYGDEAVLEEARRIGPGDEAIRALDTLGHVYGDLKGAGLNSHIYIDLGMIRDQDYYTGIVFEGYTRGTGHPVLGGGRYDRLAQRFGKDLPATGFAVHMERLMAVLPAAPEPVLRPEIMVVPVPGREAEAIQEADRLRLSGERVLLEITGRSLEKAREFAHRQGCRSLRVWQEDQWIQEDLNQGGINHD